MRRERDRARASAGIGWIREAQCSRFFCAGKMEGKRGRGKRREEQRKFCQPWSRYVKEQTQAGIEAFNLLRHAVAVRVDNRAYTFAQVYAELVDARYAIPFIKGLLDSLWRTVCTGGRHFARAMPSKLKSSAIWSGLGCVSRLTTCSTRLLADHLTIC